MSGCLVTGALRVTLSVTFFHRAVLKIATDDVDDDDDDSEDNVIDNALTITNDDVDDDDDHDHDVLDIVCHDHGHGPHHLLHAHVQLGKRGHQ